MRRLAIASLLFLSCFPLTSFSKDCGDLTTQYDMNQCALKEYQIADRELNRLYNAYRARLNDSQKREIRDIQRTWAKFRDLSCEFESSSVQGGSAYPFVFQSCLTLMTHERIVQLESLANCEEGDLACPAPKR